MGGRQILFLGQEAVLLYRFRGRRLCEAFAFPNGEEGREALGALLVTRSDPALLLVDLAEEEFRLERVPRTGPGDRKALLRGRSQRLFGATPFRSARRSARLPGGEDLALFSALTRPERIQPWLDTLRGADLPLLGILSVPLVSGALIAPLRLREGHLLLATLQAAGGLRQSLFVEGRLTASRLSPLPHDLTPPDYARFLQGEALRTRHYLERMQLIPGGAPLPVVAPSAGERLDALCRHPEEPLVPFRPLAMEGLFRALRLDPRLAAPEADLLFASLALGRIAGDYRSDEDRHRHLSWRLERLVKGATGMVAAVALAAGGMQLLEANIALAAARAAAAQAARFERLAPPLAEGERLRAEAAAVRDALLTAEGLAALNRRPDRLLAEVGRLLAAFPLFSLSRLDWGAGEETDLPGAEEAPPGVPSAAPRLPPGRIYQGLLIEGRIAAQGYRPALAQLDALTAALRRLPGVVAVETPRRPLDLRPSNRLEGRAVEAVAGAHPFTLRVVVEVAR